MADLHAQLASLPGRGFARGDGGARWSRSPTTSRTPIWSTVTTHQGVRIVFDDDARIVLRVCGIGSEGATPRLYLERFEPDVARHDVQTQAALATPAAIAEEIAGVRARTGRDAPSVVT